MARLRWLTALLFVALVGALLALPNDASSQVCPWSVQFQRTQIQVPNRMCAPPMQVRLQPQLRLPLPQINFPRVSLQPRPPIQTQVRLNLQFQPRLPQLQFNLRVPSRPILLRQQVPVRPGIPTFTRGCVPQPRLQLPQPRLQLPQVPRTVQFSRPPIQTRVALQPRLPQINLRIALTPRLPQVPQMRPPQVPQLVRARPQIPIPPRPVIPQLRANPPINLVTLRTRFTCVGCHVRCNPGGPNLGQPPGMPGQFINRPLLPPPVFVQRPNLLPPVFAQRPNLPNLLVQRPTLPNLLLLQRPNLPQLVLQRPNLPALPLMLQPPVQVPTLLARMPAVTPVALPVALRRPDATPTSTDTPPGLQVFLARPLPEGGETQSPGEQIPPVSDSSDPSPMSAHPVGLNLLALERREATSRQTAPHSSTPSLLETLRGGPTFTVAVREALDRPALPGLPPTVLQRATSEEPGEPAPSADPELPLDHPQVVAPVRATPARSEVNLPLPPTVLAR